MNKTGIFCLFSLAALLSACALAPETKTERPLWKTAEFSELDGWEKDDKSEALAAFVRSCKAMGKKDVWKKVCGSAEEATTAKEFFEKQFDVYRAENYDEGLFTGYYEAEIEASLRKNGKYSVPVWQKPQDLVTADLGEFYAELKGKKLTAKVEKGKLKPYDSREEIAAGSLFQRAEPLLWADDPVDVFFMEIQGSGRAKLEDGSVVRIGFAAQNGKQYVPIGRLLAEEGWIERPVTMAKIREWLRKNPDKAQAMMNRNPSFVFFQKGKAAENPVGAQNVPLTPERSLAVDAAFIPLGAPLWLEVNNPPIKRLVIAQDTGGAIKGAMRGDLFWGAGPRAEEMAGAMQGKGVYYLLYPKGYDPNE